MAVIAITSSCKKDVGVKPAPAKAKATDAVQAPKPASNATYDYQRAIMAKRTVMPGASGN